MAEQKKTTLTIKPTGQKRSLTSRVLGKGRKLFVPEKKNSQPEEGTYGTHSHHKEEQPQVNVRRPSRCQAKPKLKLKSKNKHKLALRILEKEFPKVFNLAFPKPLSVGIREELIASKKEISNKQIRLGLFFYCNSHQYLRCVKEDTHRVNATGRYVKKVTKEEEQDSVKRLRILFAKIKKNR
jgi:hypothetical protein